MTLVTRAFMYRWTHISGKWYVGSRTAIGSHPGDGYICSSKIVKPMILESITDWHRQILAIGDPRYIRTLESKFLSAIDAKNDHMSFNMHNGNGDFSTTGISPSASTRKKMSIAGLGKAKPDGFADKCSKIHTGKVYSMETRAKIGKSSTGRIPTTETKLKISEKLIGRVSPRLGVKLSSTELLRMRDSRASGIRSGSWTCYWVSPSGTKYTTLKDAFMSTGVPASTIREWARLNKFDWSVEQIKKCSLKSLKGMNL